MHANASTAVLSAPWARTAETSTFAAAAGPLLLIASRERPGSAWAWRIYRAGDAPGQPAAGHVFARAGQVRADLPPRDHCVACGASEAAHHEPVSGRSEPLPAALAGGSAASRLAAQHAAERAARSAL